MNTFSKISNFVTIEYTKTMEVLCNLTCLYKDNSMILIIYNDARKKLKKKTENPTYDVRTLNLYSSKGNKSDKRSVL